jgi:hypothetical protein
MEIKNFFYATWYNYFLIVISNEKFFVYFFWANVALNEFSQLLFIIVSWNRLGKEK